MNNDPRRRSRREEAANLSRKNLLEEGSNTAGERWAAGWRDDLRAQGRPAAGGWPGTVAEARARVIALLGPELHRRKMVALTHEELERAARCAYARARRDWLARNEREAPEPV
jgi:hypothetical protein